MPLSSIHNFIIYFSEMPSFYYFFFYCHSPIMACVHIKCFFKGNIMCVLYVLYIVYIITLFKLQKKNVFSFNAYIFSKPFKIRCCCCCCCVKNIINISYFFFFPKSISSRSKNHHHLRDRIIKETTIITLHIHTQNKKLYTWCRHIDTLNHNTIFFVFVAFIFTFMNSIPHCVPYLVTLWAGKACCAVEYLLTFINNLFCYYGGDILGTIYLHTHN